MDREQKEDQHGEENGQIETLSIFVETPRKGRLTLQVALTDTVHDVRQYLSESADSCCMTAYHFALSGQSVQDFAELSELKPLGLQDGCTLQVVEDQYDERTARLHVKRLRELMYVASASQKEESPCVYSSIHGGKLNPITNVGDEDNVNLGALLPNATPKIKFLKQISYSGWNPPRPNRKLQGDLFYLDVVTLEDESFVISAWTNGFYVNNTKAGVFDPAPSPKPHRSRILADLLAELSPKFKEQFGPHAEQHFQSPPHETLSVPFPVYSWVAHPEKPEYDVGKAEDYMLDSCDIDFFVQGQHRDWNEDLQGCRNLPKRTSQEKITRDRSLFRVHLEFVEAAKKGAVAIIDGCVPPINATDEKKAHMYIYNNIFYSYAVDSRDYFKNLGGDAAAYKSASNDLLGLKMFNKLEVDGLYTLATALINYRGFRLIAQSIIAGLFSSLMQEEQSSGSSIPIVYGSLDGDEINCDPEFHELMKDAARDMYMRPHVVIDKSGKEVTLAAHTDIKGIRGTDGRKYLLDLVRTTPRDHNFPELTDTTAILRPELIDAFLRAERDKVIISHIEEMKAEAKEGGMVLDEKNKQELTAKIEKIRININPDLLTQHKLGGSTEELVADMELSKKLADHLNTVVIPNFVEDFISLRLRVMDGAMLVKALHAQGINLRYMGRVTQLVEAKKAPAFTVLPLQREMIVRVTTHIFNSYLKNIKNYSLADVVVEFLNAFFGRNTKGEKGFKSGVGQGDTLEALEPQPALSQVLPQEVTSEILGITHNPLWRRIRDRVKSKYQYSLPDLIPGDLFSQATLRSLCHKVGIQLVAKKYSLGPQAFTSADVIRLFPVVKHSAPESKEGNYLFDLGKTFISDGRPDKAFDYLNAALEFFTQAYGPIHQDVGDCLSSLAKVLHLLGEAQPALLYQQKALVISERVSGLDSYETAQHYATLASFHKSIKSDSLAFKFIKRALFLNKLAIGSPNTDEISYLTLYATLLQERGKKEESLNHLKRSLELCENIYGSSSLQAATAAHAVAVSLSVTGQYKDAIPHATRHYEILKTIIGDQDMKTMQAKVFLSQLTQKAVQHQIQQQNQQDPQQSTLLASSALSSLTDPTKLQHHPKGSSSTTSTPALAGGISIGELPINDILQYVNNNSKSALKTLVASRSLERLEGGGYSKLKDREANKSVSATNRPAVAASVVGGASPAANGSGAAAAAAGLEGSGVAAGEKQSVKKKGKGRARGGGRGGKRR